MTIPSAPNFHTQLVVVHLGPLCWGNSKPDHVAMFVSSARQLHVEIEVLSLEHLEHSGHRTSRI